MVQITKFFPRAHIPSEGDWDKLAEAQKQSGIYKLLLLFDECLHLSGRDGNGVVAKTSTVQVDMTTRRGQRRLKDKFIII